LKLQPASTFSSHLLVAAIIGHRVRSGKLAFVACHDASKAWVKVPVENPGLAASIACRVEKMHTDQGSHPHNGNKL
jgi:hypothetical protein